jgi:hypothetical protein
MGYDYKERARQHLIFSPFNELIPIFFCQIVAMLRAYFKGLSLAALLCAAVFAPADGLAQSTYAVPGEGLCTCLDPENYLILKKKTTVSNTSFTEYYAGVETLISFLGYYGLAEPHIYNLNYPDDLLVGIGDLSALLTGFNVYPSFDGAMCSWAVVMVASHGWILSDDTGVAEAYIHESSFDEFDDAEVELFGSCDLNSFDLEMVYLPDSVVMLTFAKRYSGGGAPE